MSQPPRQPAPANPANPLPGAELASVRPLYINVSDHAQADVSGPPQYVIAKTLLGDPVLCWIEPWLAGLFCIVLIADVLGESAWREMVLLWPQAAALPPPVPKRIT